MGAGGATPAISGAAVVGWGTGGWFSVGVQVASAALPVTTVCHFGCDRRQCQVAALHIRSVELRSQDLVLGNQVGRSEPPEILGVTCPSTCLVRLHPACLSPPLSSSSPSSAIPRQVAGQSATDSQTVLLTGSARALLAGVWTLAGII